MTEQSIRPYLGRVCFVTIGATAAFDSLIRAVFEDKFVRALRSAGFSDMIIQYGANGKKLFDQLSREYEARPPVSPFCINGFHFNTKGLGAEMRAAKGKGHKAESRGIVISHAGSGSVLDALRVGVPVIVVPNPELLDDHQTQLAEALAKQDYVVHGKLDDMTGALREIDVLMWRLKDWPPVNSGVHRHAQGVEGIADEEVGYLDGSKE
ncbi:glycosyltransferase family 1 protein [Aulographum hederae CBS 113979]|uniref:UDP-N-acetylglucosamine transferase subunit ALG13 n=1 Tax=Aulographum hederae CBS 113979 TaxID=1176131 RepID=A0A6G1GZL6_9PEZI|nr:glycosyltransferase family 1 protein [Aulographum hederae CBS 113979]